MIIGKIIKFFLPLIFAISVISTITANTQLPDSIQSKPNIDTEIENIFNSLDMTGLGIAVVKNDSIIWQKSFGYQVLPDKINPGIQLQDDGIFRIASISKTFVATAIMQLNERGMLSLDDDAQQYLNFPLRNPDYPDKAITIKMLLTHTSSINDSRSWWSIDKINPVEDKDYKECYSRTLPGSSYKYCNMNYTLLGAVIEGASGRRFYEFIDSDIMKPLGLTGGFNCNVLDSSKFVKQYRFKEDLNCYVEDDETYRPYKFLFGKDYKLGKSLGLTYPPSGMKISTGNLARYMMMHMYGGSLNGVMIISEESERLMQQNYVGKNNYGLSYRQYKDLIPGKTLYGQTGGGNGLKGCMIFDPIDKIGFIILCSGSKSRYIDGYGDIHKPLIKLLYSEIFDKAADAVTKD